MPAVRKQTGERKGKRSERLRGVLSRSRRTPLVWVAERRSVVDRSR